MDRQLRALQPQWWQGNPSNAYLALALLELFGEQGIPYPLSIDLPERIRKGVEVEIKFSTATAWGESYDEKGVHPTVRVERERVFFKCADFTGPRLTEEQILALADAEG